MKIFPLFIFLIISCSTQKEEKPSPNIFNWAQKIRLDSAGVKQLEAEFENVINSGHNSAYRNEFIQVAVRYHDERVLNFWKWILQSENEHLICTALRSISRTPSTQSAEIIEPYIRHKNRIVRQFAVNALGRLGEKELLKKNKNRETAPSVLEVYKANLRQKNEYFEFLPVFSKSEFLKEPFIYKSVSLDNEDKIKRYIDTTPRVIRSFGSAYPTEKWLDSLPGTPTLNNFWRNSLSVYHAGFDNSWDWQGLPVFSVFDGVVRMIWYDVSWGVMICIESIVKGEFITTIYGHLDKRIPVAIGEKVYAGQTIGEIGGATTLVNGGYRSHLHLGIERCKFFDCNLNGYALDSNRWYSPKDFIEKNKWQF
jgi:murein DD-endopeptidase MepM/ murein hydrolase activator NlpD